MAKRKKKRDRKQAAKSAAKKKPQDTSAPDGKGTSDEKGSAERKKPGKLDRLFWQLLPLALLFILCIRLKQSVPSPWAEILTAVQVLCPIVAVVLFIRAFPHPLRSMNKKLAAERAQLRKESRRKKKRP